MNEWLTPQGILAICAIVTTVVLPLVVRVLTLANAKKETIEKVSAVQVSALEAQKVAASLVAGVNDFKRLASPQAAMLLVDTLRARNETTGVQETVRPIVDAVAEGVAPIEAVRTATTRYRRVS